MPTQLALLAVTMMKCALHVIDVIHVLCNASKDLRDMALKHDSVNDNVYCFRLVEAALIKSAGKQHPAT